MLIEQSVSTTNKVVLFTHIPRTGGTSLTDILETYFGPNRMLRDGTAKFVDFSKFRMTPEDLSRIDAVSAHMYYGIHERFKKDYIYIGLVRHPVARFLSVVRYIQMIPEHYLYPHLVGKHPDVCLDILIDRNESRLFMKQCEFFCQSDSFNLARRNIDEKYFLVGATEYLFAFLELMSASVFRQKFVAYRHVNQSPNAAESLSFGQQKKLERLAQEDLALHEYVTKELARLYRKLLPGHENFCRQF